MVYCDFFNFASDFANRKVEKKLEEMKMNGPQEHWFMLLNLYNNINSIKKSTEEGCLVGYSTV
jgi:hypothetical protein